MAALGLVDGLSPRDLSSPAFAALAWTGLYALGFGLGRAGRGRPGARAAALLLLAGLLAVLPVAGGFLGGPPPPEVAARLLDLSPVTLLAECAGLDWMRHPAVYDPAGTADIDPSLRVPWRGELAGPGAFLVGCAAAAAGAWIARARSVRSGGEGRDGARSTG